jgi:hypothetical protein
MINKIGRNKINKRVGKRLRKDRAIQRSKIEEPMWKGLLLYVIKLNNNNCYMGILLLINSTITAR